jgi:hypothetical protein
MFAAGLKVIGPGRVSRENLASYQRPKQIKLLLKDISFRGGEPAQGENPVLRRLKVERFQATDRSVLTGAPNYAPGHDAINLFTVSASDTVKKKCDMKPPMMTTGS